LLRRLRRSRTKNILTCWVCSEFRRNWMTGLAWFDIEA
jgi:hypothetical protein